MKPVHLFLALGLVSAAVGSTGHAQAQAKEFAQRGEFVVSAERLTGVFITSGESELDGTIGNGPIQGAVNSDSDDSSTSFVFLGNGLEAAPASAARLGADFFVIDHLSVGGSLAYASRSETSERTNRFDGGQLIDRTETEVTDSLLSINPRAGYGLMFTNVIGLWARGGFTYTQRSTETDVTDLEDPGDVESSELDGDLFALSVDAQLILSPIQHVAFGIGPQLDIPLTGSLETTNIPVQANVEGDLSILTFGVSAGLLVWF